MNPSSRVTRGRFVRVQCYLHTNTHAPQGWYPKAERVITLGRPFRMS